MEFYTNKALDPKRKKRYKRAELQNYSIFRSNISNNAGLKLERRIAEDGSKKYFIREITAGGLFEQQGFPLEVGDRIVQINDVEIEDFPGLFQIHELIKKEKEITISLLKEDKEKKWLHAKPMQYPGNMDKQVHKEEFQPKSTTYPPPAPAAAAPPVAAPVSHPVTTYPPPAPAAPPVAPGYKPSQPTSAPEQSAEPEPEYTETAEAPPGHDGEAKSCCCDCCTCCTIS
jgi:hypothetical protein